MTRIGIALIPLLLSILPVNAIAQDVVPDDSNSGRRVDDLRIELGIMGGAIALVGWNNEVVGGQGALDLRMSWPVGSNTRIGFRVGLAAAGLEWQCSQDGDHISCRPDRIHPEDVPDGEEYIFKFGVQPTLIPQAGFLLAYDASKWFTFEVTTGLGLVIPVKALHGDSDNSIPYGHTPLPSAGLAGTFALGGTKVADIGLSVRLDVFFTFKSAYLLPQAGLVIRF